MNERTPDDSWYWYCPGCDYRISDTEYYYMKCNLPCPRCRKLWIHTHYRVRQWATEEEEE